MGTLKCTPKYRGTIYYDLVKAELIQAARMRGVVVYDRVAELMGITERGSHMAKETGHILGEISEDEVNFGRPMLSSVAVSVTNYRAGDGFFNMARELGLLKTKLKGDEPMFWSQELRKVYNTWAQKYPR